METTASQFISSLKMGDNVSLILNSGVWIKGKVEEISSSGTAVTLSSVRINGESPLMNMTVHREVIQAWGKK
jgi:hypothetical protein